MIPASRPEPIEPAWTRRPIRAPREDFGVLSDPSLGAALETARSNHATLASLEVNLQGRTVAQLREWSRCEILAAAREYTAQMLAAAAPGLTFSSDKTAADEANRLLFVAGHQPALFHPGVWIKNFAIHKLARRSGGLSLNLSVDTDIMGPPRIRVPVGERSYPLIEHVAFDADRPRAPWEENAILDRQLFDSFGDRVQQALVGWDVRPLIESYWPRAVLASRQFPYLRDCFVAARSVIEREWGAGNLELPISRLGGIDPFLWFASHILAHLPRFCSVHNEVLGEYRQVNRIRSRTHPVPELKSKEGWFEAPFWIWREGDSVRGRLFARQEGREVRLSNGVDVFSRLRLTPDGEACCAVEELRTLPEKGLRLRPRALATTLYSRLTLADLFVHGIGGAKYDEMTDRIFTRFFQVTPPGFLTMTATLYPSIAEPFAVSHNDELRLMRRLRDLRWNADRYLDEHNSPEAARLIARKKELRANLGRDGTPGEQRYRQMHETNRALADLAADRARQTAEDLERARKQLEANALLHDREFAFVLYPADKLKRLMESL